MPEQRQELLKGFTHDGTLGSCSCLLLHQVLSRMLRQKLEVSCTLQGSEQTWEGPAWLPGFHAPLNKLPCFERVRPNLTDPSVAIHTME